MKIDLELVEKLSSLARIKLNDEEKVVVSNDLNKILSLVSKLNELDTTGIEPLVHLSEEVSEWRADEIDQRVARKDILKNAPEKSKDFISVPKVVRK